MTSMLGPSRAIIDVAALTQNTANLAARTNAELMAIVKADGYGHGAVTAAHAAVAGGATRLGIAQVAEAVALAAQLPAVPVFAWLYSPATDLAPALQAGIELSVNSPWALRSVADTAAELGVTARVHLAFDVGMAREGARPEVWSELLAAVKAARALEVTGIWSHLTSADDRSSSATAAELHRFEAAVAEAEQLGIEPEVRHLAASSGLLWHPATHFDMVRAGISLYGMAPDGSDPAALGLRRVMRLEAELSNVQRVPAGTPVSYGGIEQTHNSTVLGTVPLGYADGIPRQASGQGAWVTVNGQRANVIGRVCMDQFMVDLGPDSGAAPGDIAVVFGGQTGASAEDWAQAGSTINYAITTAIGARVPRVNA